MASFTINQSQLNELVNNIVEGFSGKEFTSEDIDSLINFKKNTKVKKVKDPKAPKRGLSAWIYFTSEKRAEVKEQNPDKKTTELTTIMSEMWADYTDEQKEPYKKMELADKERFAKEKVVYESESNSDNSDSENEVVKKVKKVKKVKDENAPKKNLNSYMLFSKEIRAKNPDVKYTAAALKPLWANIEDKSKYEELAKADKERYLKEKGEYESK